jgi:hypothetical protein
MGDWMPGNYRPWKFVIYGKVTLVVRRMPRLHLSVDFYMKRRHGSIATGEMLSSYGMRESTEILKIRTGFQITRTNTDSLREQQGF